jgi:benzoate membrane transport protein
MREISAAAVSAGLTAFVWYACGGIPLQLSVAAQLGLTPAQASSSVFIVWTSGAVASIALSLRLRQPIPITWTIPGLVYMGSLAGRFSVAEITAGALVAALILAALAAAGVGGRVMRWLPLPIVMGMFAGSLLDYLVRAVTATVADLAIAGSVLGGYLAARWIGAARVPPAGAALLAGSLAVALSWKGAAPDLAWELPRLLVPQFDFDPAAIAAVSLPLVVLAMGLGNVQGLGFVLGQGYAVPVDRVSRAVATASIVNALFGGAPATVARNGAAILAAPGAGVLGARYWAVVLSSALTIVLALAATPAASLLASLPKSFVVALAGVALVSSMQDALEKAFGGAMRFGALTAFVVAVSPFSLLGITSAFWALVAGVFASLLAERAQLVEFWRGSAMPIGQQT